MENPEKIEIEGLKTIHKLCKFGADHNMEGCTFTEIVERMFSKIEQMKTQVNTLDEMLLNQGEVLAQAKAQAVPEGFGLFDGDTLTYSNGYSINCSFDDEFDCHVFDVSKDGCYIKTGMTQLEQAHCFVLSMIKLDAKDSTLEAQEQKG